MESLSGRPRKDLTWHRAPLADGSLGGKRVLVVGGTGGLGQAIARRVARAGAEVTVVGQTFRDAGTPRISFVRADLSAMKEAKRLGETLDASADVVLLTTGIFASPQREVTAEGLERDMAVSYLSRLVLVRALAPRLKPGARVFVMGFPGTGQAGALGDLNFEKKYQATEVHMTTVAGNEALVLDAVKRYPAAQFFGLNPGLIKTNIRANFLGGNQSLRFKVTEALIGLFMTSADQYADRTAPLLFAPELEGKSGAMFNQKGRAIEATAALDAARVGQLISESEALVARVV